MIPVRHYSITTACALGCIALGANDVEAQGCEPIRFTIPVSLGAEGEAYQPGGEWRATIAYRRLLSNEWFVGSKENGSLAPGGQSPVFRINTYVADVAYSINDRFRARISVPFSAGSLSRKWADGQFHKQTASGIGDISLQGEAWLLNPRAHPRRNMSVALGVKAPTGSHDKASQFFLASGAVDFPADQTIQPGDGGWAVMTQVQGFTMVAERVSLYGIGSYMVSPKDRTDIKNTPATPQNSGLYWSVPDVYSVRSGVAVEVLADQGLSMSLGARVDGIPVRDVVGGGDENTVKRTSRVTFIDPGLSLSKGRNNFTLSVPWRVKVIRMKSLTEQLPTASPTANSGGFAKYLVFASYSRRF